MQFTLIVYALIVTLGVRGLSIVLGVLSIRIWCLLLGEGENSDPFLLIYQISWIAYRYRVWIVACPTHRPHSTTSIRLVGVHD